MKNLFLLLLLSPLVGNSQNFTLSGTIKDAKNGETITGASITLKDKTQAAITNNYGYYSLSLPKGTYEVSYSNLGFTTETKTVVLDKNTVLNMELASVEKELDGVTIKDNRKNRNVEKVEIGTVQIDAATIKKIPAVLGEVDVIKSIQMLPGVSTIGEGAAGFNVRGGSVDQNLILQDEAPVYNSSHALGFFSVFNPDAVKDVKLIKGGIPAIYGGRLSSVLDIRMKDGNMKKFAGSGGIGSIFSRLMLEGPIKKDKASFMIAYRRSYADVFFPLFNNEALKKSILNFSDFNAKLNWTIDKKNRVFLSSYIGRDNFGLSDFFGINWGNQNVTLRWNHIYSSKTFANYSAIFSNYDYSLGSEQATSAFKWVSHIRFYNLRADHTYYPNSKNTIQYGGQLVYYDYRPGETEPVPGKQSFINADIAMQRKFAIEPNLYISNEQTVNKRLSMTYGIRYNGFANIGKDTSVYVYKDAEKRSGDNIIDTLEFGAGEMIKYWQGVEPRFAMKYTMDKESSIKAGYNRMRQNIHLVTNTSSASPLDVYLPSDRNFKPQIADQVSVGYFRNFKKNMYETSVETFYKTYQNIIDFKDGANLVANNMLDTVMLRGKGESYGLELFIRKQNGKLTGWISYTISQTTRTIDGINGGKKYFSPYDKTHVLNITASYELNKHWSFSANFAYSTGIPITVPAQKFVWQGITASDPSGRNTFRIQTYHRADASITYKGKKKKKQLWQGEWVLSAYNVYARRNAFSMYFRQDPNDPTRTQAVRISVFGTVIPAITYNFNF
ncbi:MAG: TonB-dependent receptor [Flavobacteriaceae bacterium]|nr:TonB-dependent receptor [Flavobacteriaceae bacterium]